MAVTWATSRPIWHFPSAAFLTEIITTCTCTYLYMYVGLYKLDFPKETRLLYCGNRGRILYASLYAHAAFMNGITPTCTLYLGLYKNLLSKRDPPFVFRQSPWCAPSESLCRLCMYMYVCMYVCIYLSIYLSIYLWSSASGKVRTCNELYKLFWLRNIHWCLQIFCRSTCIYLSIFLSIYM